MTFGPLTQISPGESLAVLADLGDLLAGRGVDELALLVGQQRSHRADRDVVAVVGHRVRDRAELAHAVALHHAGVDAAARGLGGLAVERRGAGEHGVHGRDVELVDDRMLRERDGDRRGDVQVGAAVVLDVREELDQIELRHRHEARPLAQREVEQHGHSVDVEERQHREHAVGALQVDVRRGTAARWRPGCGA